MTTDIQRGTGEKGTWRPFLAYSPEPDCKPYWSAALRCPSCGARMNLSRHAIDAGGVVTPSIGHPEGVPDCGWHPAPGRLIGWEEAVAQPLPRPPDMHTCASCQRQSRWIGGWGTDGRFTGGIVCDLCIAALRSSSAPKQEGQQ